MPKARPTTKADETAEFVEFWECWRPYARHTDGRGSARDEFCRHVEQYKADPQDLVDGAKWFLLTMKEGDREFVPLAASWLNRRAYEDGAEMWRARQAKLNAARSPAPNVIPIQSARPSEDERREQVSRALARLK